jgi:hypothetical protein
MADFLGLYPYESSRKTGSTFGSVRSFTTICAVLSATVGTPSVLVPPLFFGIATAFTGGGKYNPDAILFHSLYRLFAKSFSNSTIDTSSIPAAPLSAAAISLKRLLVKEKIKKIDCGAMTAVDYVSNWFALVKSNRLFTIEIFSTNLLILWVWQQPPNSTLTFRISPSPQCEKSRLSR